MSFANRSDSKGVTFGDTTGMGVGVGVGAIVTTASAGALPSWIRSWVGVWPNALSVTVAHVAPGTYNLKFQANGFAVKDVPNLTVRSDDNNRIDQTLSIETITATVEVTNSIPEYSVSGAAVMVSVSQPLVKAADSDDLNSLNEALTINPDPNVRDQHTGANALECAVRNANREIIQALLWAKADVNKDQ